MKAMVMRTLNIEGRRETGSNLTMSFAMEAR